MQYRRLGRAGLRVSALSLGSWVTYHNQVGTDSAVEMMAAAFDGGINFFDNAEGYAGGLQRTAVVSALAGPVKPQPPARAVPQRGLELLFQPSGVDHHLAHTRRGQGLEVPLDEALPAHRQQRLGRVVGQRAHPLAPACRQDEGVHAHAPGV